MAEQLKYKFVKKGHYIMRQGQKSDYVYFIVDGGVNVIMWGEPDKAYLNKDQMYNDCSLQHSREALSVVAFCSGDAFFFVFISMMHR